VSITNPNDLEVEMSKTYLNAAIRRRQIHKLDIIKRKVGHPTSRMDLLPKTNGRKA